MWLVSSVGTSSTTCSSGGGSSSSLRQFCLLPLWRRSTRQSWRHGRLSLVVPPCRRARTGVPPSRQLAVPVAQLWKDAVSSVIAAAVAETLPHSHDPLPAGKRRARSTLLDDFADRQSAAGALALQLDLECVARVLASTPERVASAPKRSAHLSIAHFVSWSAGYIRTATNILRRLRSFTANAKTVDGLQLASFLDHIDRDARRKMTAKSTSSSAAGAPAEVDGFVRTDAGGSTAAVSALNSLKWLSVNAGIMLPIHAPALGRFKGKKADASAASPSVCLSLRAVTSLDINSKKEGNNEFVQGHCAAWAFLHYSVSRLAQAQRASFVLDRDHARTMVTAREKTPIVRAARPRAFWAPSRGMWTALPPMLPVPASMGGTSLHDGDEGEQPEPS
ncbi:hypothetical protein RI054_29g117270 [Pseudoscourfieldia marina]